MFPSGIGRTLYLEDDFQDQTANWSGSSRAPAADNPDKEIRTNFTVAGFQDMFSRDWGIQLEQPYVTRHFGTTGGASGDDPVTLDWGAFGDLRLEGVYTGLAEDLSTGVTLGLKLPTGDFTHNDPYGDIDRDSEIGTGSTDLLLGGFHRGNIPGSASWTWFVQAAYDRPMDGRDGYRPGAELDAAAGLYCGGPRLGRVSVTPLAQVKFSNRTSDSGMNAANPVASGFHRLLLVPGLEFDAHPFSVHVDVELPAWQHFTGNQLAAPALYKVSVAYMF